MQERSAIERRPSERLHSAFAGASPGNGEAPRKQEPPSRVLRLCRHPDKAWFTQTCERPIG